jgi:hypothetical protein
MRPAAKEGVARPQAGKRITLFIFSLLAFFVS